MIEKIGFIGTGNLATAIIGGVISSSCASPADVFIYDNFTEKTALLKEKYSVNVCADAAEVVRKSDAVVVAVKPKDMADLLESISDEVKGNNPLIISTAAGTTLDFLSSCLPQGARIVRIMPNINAAVGEAMTAFCGTSAVSEDDFAFADKLCSSFGKAMKLDESLFSAFTAAGGSAPAFVYMFIDELAQASVRQGISEEDARVIACQTVLGSALMVSKSSDTAGELVVKVCSPGGTTIEGVAALKEHNFHDMIDDAITRTADKDRFLQKQKG